MPTIERLHPDHTESFHACLDTVAKEGRWIGRLHAPPLEKTRAFVTDCFDNAYPQFAALHEGRVVGWVDVLPARKEISRHVGVLGIGLHPDFRGQGLGQKLLEKVLAAAPDAGFEIIYLDVYASNARALALYEKMGFVRDGLRPQMARLPHGDEDAVSMHKRL